MIHVKRKEAPEIFTRNNSPAARERTRAEKHYTSQPPKTEAFKFTFYSSYKDDYKDILVNMFNSRCAYCECFVTVGNRGDIEHFRPKGEFVRRDGTVAKPGYYLLASDWNNLYLSCTNCNQSTTFRILNANNPGEIITRSAGKMNQFALSDEGYRRTNLMLVKDEEPYRLLIDPCSDNPEVLIEFTSEGILKARETNGVQDPKALYSIDVYVLQREVLVKARKEKYLQVMDKIEFVDTLSKFVIDDIRQEKNDVRAQFDGKQLETAFLLLLGFLDIEKIPNEYIGLARQYIHPFLTAYSIRLIEALDPIHQNQPWYPAMIAYLEPQVTAMKAYFDKK